MKFWFHCKLTEFNNFDLVKTLLAPSILSADFLKLEQDIQMINESQADLFHLDIMDGRFVPNITFGFNIIKQIKSVAKKPLDVHLMIEQPDKYLKEFRNAGADYLSVHYETCPHLHRTVEAIKSMDMKAGVVINPHNPVELLSGIVNVADYILLMSVNPGFGGQKFIDQTLNRIKRLKNILSENHSTALIEVDGGVDLSNARQLTDAGANILVAGNSIFSTPNPSETIAEFKRITG